MRLPKSFRVASAPSRPSTRCTSCDKKVGMVRVKGSGIKRCLGCGKVQ